MEKNNVYLKKVLKKIVHLGFARSEWSIAVLVRIMSAYRVVEAFVPGGVCAIEANPNAGISMWDGTGGWRKRRDCNWGWVLTPSFRLELASGVFEMAWGLEWEKLSIIAVIDKMRIPNELTHGN